MNQSDENLIRSYVEKGDQNAFRILVERHQERVFGYLMGMVRDRDVANDLFQETYVRVISALAKKRGSYSDQGRWLAWVMRIARNAALDHLRSRKKWVDVDKPDDTDDSYWDRMADEAPSADRAMEMRFDAEVLRSCIEKLPTEQREVLLLRHEAEMPFKDIAVLTDCSINTALGRMRYALLNLKKMVTEESNTANRAT